MNTYISSFLNLPQTPTTLLLWVISEIKLSSLYYTAASHSIPVFHICTDDVFFKNLAMLGLSCGDVGS